MGQRSVVQTLTNAIDNDRIAHAYLFTGPRGTGKTSSARILAKSLNCQNGPTAEPCMQCTTCVEIKQGISPAVMEIDAASNNSVDDARVIIERAPLVAQGGRFKLYIIDECHMLTKEAFNALLKTIEEPPPNVIFILATTEEHKVPPTIISRCQRLMFKLVNLEDLTAHLRDVATRENINIDDDAIALIARRCGGGMRDAMGLLDQASLLATDDNRVGVKDLLTLLGAIDEDVLLDISIGVRDRDGEKVLTAVHDLLSQGREPSLVAMELSKHFLNLTKALHLSGGAKKAGGEEMSRLISGSSGYLERITALAPDFAGYELTQMVEILDRLEQSLRRSTQPALSLEVGLLSLCHRQEINLVKDLAQRLEEVERLLAGGAVAIGTPNTASAPPPPKTQAPVPAAEPAPRPAERTAERTVERPAAQPQPVKEPARVETPLAVPPTRPAAPQPAIPKTPATPASGESFESTVSLAEIEAFWSNMLDELHNSSIPTYSLVSQFGFPLALRDDELVIGTTRDNFQKTLESKSEHIKQASKKILGRELFIKVKVQTGDVKPTVAPPPPRGRDEEPPRDQPPAREPATVPAPRESGTLSRATADSEMGPDDDEPEPAPFKAEFETQAPKARTRPEGKAANVPPPESGEQLMVKEAYKLFEGPGSRSIG